jgi:hypothetical protein
MDMLAQRPWTEPHFKLTASRTPLLSLRSGPRGNYVNLDALAALDAFAAATSVAGSATA